MIRLSSAPLRFKSVLPLLLVLYVPTLLVIAGVFVVHIKTDIPLSVFFNDPLAEFNAPMYVGCLSNFGILLWCSSASVCLFCGWILLKNDEQHELSLFLLCSGLISALMTLDDLFMLHEELLPDHFFIPQPVVLAFYGMLIAVWFFRFRKSIPKWSQASALLILALGFFLMSVIVDVFVKPEEFYIIEGLASRHLIEDGLKLLGIVSWAAFLIGVSARQVGLLVGTSASGR